MLAVAALVFGLALAASAAAETSPPSDGWAYPYFQEAMSPFCPGRTLSACTSGQAESLRMWILIQEAAGRSRDDVHRELFERYGDVILAAPEAVGFGITAYVIPLVVFRGGGLLVVYFLRRQAGDAATARARAPAIGPVDPEIERLIDEELAR
jgi:cytochrome c-type biogenesis protein CcmH/NrfF